jgi:hypothetical protein
VITGAHAIIYSTKPELDRAFMRDVLGLPSVDMGGGWLIFGLPPSEVAVHPAEENGRHELYFLVQRPSHRALGTDHERDAARRWHDRRLRAFARATAGCAAITRARDTASGRTSRTKTGAPKRKR